MIQPLTGYKIQKRNLSVNVNFAFVKRCITLILKIIFNKNGIDTRKITNFATIVTQSNILNNIKIWK